MRHSLGTHATAESPRVSSGRQTLGILLFLLTVPLPAAEWVKKEVKDSWTWVEDYVVTTATYVVACEPGRECEVGTGVYAFGKPRGQKIRLRGEGEISVLGLGEVYIRSADGKGTAKAAHRLKTASAVRLPPISW